MAAEAAISERKERESGYRNAQIAASGDRTLFDEGAR